MMKNLSAGGMGGLKNMFSGKMDMFSAMNSGRKIKQRSTWPIKWAGVNLNPL